MLTVGPRATRLLEALGEEARIRRERLDRLEPRTSPMPAPFMAWVWGSDLLEEGEDLPAIGGALARLYRAGLVERYLAGRGQGERRKNLWSITPAGWVWLDIAAALEQVPALPVAGGLILAGTSFGAANGLLEGAGLYGAPTLKALARAIEAAVAAR